MFIALTKTTVLQVTFISVHKIKGNKINAHVLLKIILLRMDLSNFENL